jgi:hypothetical protein
MRGPHGARTLTGRGASRGKQARGPAWVALTDPNAQSSVHHIIGPRSPPDFPLDKA